MPCLTPTGIEKLKEMFKSKGSGLGDLAQMDTATRKKIIAQFMGEENADFINYEIEKRLTAKSVEVLENWAKKEIMSPKEKTDVLKRIAKLESTLSDKNSLNLITNKESREIFLEDLIAHKIGVAVTQAEAGTIMELAKNANSARKELEKIASAKTNYGKAYNEIKQGKPQEQALKDNKISQAEYDKITKEREEKGLEIYKYVNFMQQTKDNINALKKSDFVNNWWKALGKVPKEVFNTFRFSLASGELGAATRQGLGVLIKDPNIWKKNTREMLNNARAGLLDNTDFKSAVLAEIMTRPNYLSGFYKEAGLAINTVEDYAPSAWIERMINTDNPNIFQAIGQRYVKFSQDTFTAYAFQNRADLFDAYWTKLEQMGADYKEIGEYFNNLTGTGKGQIAEKASGVMFAAKYTQSQVNMLTKIITANNPEIRWEYFKNFATMVGGTAALIFLSKLFGGEVEDDPRSTKFGRLVLPNGYVMDITGGKAAYVILLSRLVDKAFVSMKWKKDTKYKGKANAQELLSRFMFSKAAPQISIPISILDQKLFGGEKMTLESFGQSLLPIFMQEAVEKFTDDDLEVFDKFMMTLGAFFGLSSYNPDDFDKRKTK